MKNLSIFCSILLLSILSSKFSTAQNQVLVKSIVYDVPIINEEMFPMDINMYYAENTWWTNNLETSKRWFLQQSIINTVKMGNLSVYSAEGKLLSKTEVDKIINKWDTMNLERPEPPFNTYDTIVSTSMDPTEIHYLRFKETWYYDQKTLTIKKVIDSYAPVTSAYGNDTVNIKEIRTPLFWIKCGDNSTKTKGYTLLTDLIEYKTAFKDLNIHFPMWNNFVSISDDSLVRQNYISSMIRSAAKGKIKVYEPYSIVNFYNYTADKVEVMDTAETSRILSSVENMTLQRTEPPYNYYDTTVYRTLNFGKISQLKFHEKWFFNKTTLEIKKQEIAISPCLIVKDEETGELKGFKILLSIMMMEPFRCY